MLRKLTFLIPPICTRKCAYTGVWNVRFLEHFPYVLNEWTLRALKSLKSCRSFCSRWNQFQDMGSQIFCWTDICICSFERWLKIWFAWALCNKIPAFADPDDILIWYFKGAVENLICTSITTFITHGNKINEISEIPLNYFFKLHVLLLQLNLEIYLSLYYMYI